MFKGRTFSSHEKFSLKRKEVQTYPRSVAAVSVDFGQAVGPDKVDPAPSTHGVPSGFLRPRIGIDDDDVGRPFVGEELHAIEFEAGVGEHLAEAVFRHVARDARETVNGAGLMKNRQKLNETGLTISSLH